MKKRVENRNYGIDIIRIIAVVLVLAVHFFLNTSYYDVPEVGLGMKVQTIIRNFCMACVPLFMLITGFLNKKIEYDKPFFKGLVNILIIWFFYSLVEYFTLNILNHNYNLLDLRNFIFSLSSFKSCGYSWYIEMYIGLYLISPIINNAYNSFDKKNRFILLLVVLFNLVIPSFVNELFDGIIHMPNWWVNIYPIGYYIIGKYISDIKPKVNKKTLIFLLILTQIITFSFNYIGSIDFNSLTTFLSSTLIFVLFYDIDIKNDIIRKIILYISNISLDIYLASSLVDKIIYPIFNGKIGLMGIPQSRIIMFAPMLLIVIFIISLIYGSIRKLIINVR